MISKTKVQSVQWIQSARMLVRNHLSIAAVLTLSACAYPNYYPQGGYYSQQAYPAYVAQNEGDRGSAVVAQAEEQFKNKLLNIVAAKCAKDKNQRECKINKINLWS